jgi:hypothetical protein
MPNVKLFAAAAVVGLFAIAGADAASAADAGTVANGKAPGYIVPAYDWSGAYAGLNSDTVGDGLQTRPCSARLPCLPTLSA